jgi:hypothetical protein
MARELLSKWTEINPKEALSANALKAYEAYKAAYKQAADLRAKFEAQLQADAVSGKVVTDGQELAISYNFGKLSLAIAKKEADKGTASRKAVSSLSALSA